MPATAPRAVQGGQREAPPRHPEGIGPAKLPNFFILGAAKSGTTTLHALLGQHPGIYLTEPKEPTYFCRQFQVVRNPISYFALFDAATTESALGEASHGYMTDPASPRVLRALFPDAKFLVILRNPADRAYSLYHHMRRKGLEYLPSFEAALEAEEYRWRDPAFRRSCPQSIFNYLYFRSGLYGQQMERYLALFPRRQFHVLTFDAFFSDTLRHLSEVFGFLGVDRSFAPELRKANEGRLTARTPRIHYWARTRVKHPGLRKHLLAWLRRYDVIPTPQPSTTTRASLLERYAADLRRLEQLTGVRLA